MDSFISNSLSSPRFQLIATAALSAATVATLIFGYQALDREERLNELKRSIISDQDHEIRRVRAVLPFNKPSS